MRLRLGFKITLERFQNNPRLPYVRCCASSLLKNRVIKKSRHCASSLIKNRAIKKIARLHQKKSRDCASSLLALTPSRNIGRNIHCPPAGWSFFFFTTNGSSLKIVFAGRGRSAGRVKRGCYKPNQIAVSVKERVYFTVLALKS